MSVPAVARPAMPAHPGSGIKGYGAVFAVIIFLVVFQTPLTVFVPQLQYFDEALLPAALLLIGRHILVMRLPRVDLLVVGMLLYLLLVSLFFGRSNSPGGQIVQVLIHLKFFLLYVLLRPLLQSPRELDRLERVFIVVGAISLFGLMLSFFMPELFQSTIGGAGTSRFGLVRATGFQVKPNDVALFLSPLLIMLVARAAILRSGMQLMLLLAVSSVIFLANTSRVAALAIPVSALLILLVGRLPKLANTVLVLLFLTCLPLLFLSQFVQEVVDYTLHDLAQFTRIEQTEYIRVIMIYYSFLLAADYFPIGSGAATYGSTMSESSPVYADLGLYGLSSVDRFIGVFDSNMATLLGEFGIIGIVMFIGLTVYVFRDIRNLLGVDTHQALIYHRVLLAFLLLIALTNPLYMYSLTSMSILLAASVGVRYFRRITPAGMAAQRPVPPRQQRKRRG